VNEKFFLSYVRKTLAAIIIVTLALGALPVKPAGAVPAFPPGFVSEAVVTNLTGPTTIAFAPDGRMFIGQKDGRVRVFQNGVLLPTDFINISSEVNNYWDRGLLGIAIHPDFPNTPYVYLLYTYDPPGTTDNGSGARVARLIRVTADPNNTNVALPGSAVVLLGTNSTLANIGDPNSNSGPPSCQSGNTYVQDCIAADSPSHTIGTLAFGTDGSLFVSSGDGAHFTNVDARALRSLSVDSLNGKILRINPITGQGYSNNPFYNGNPNSNRSKVYSLGLRNPFRITINELTNEPFIGDVGWNAWEEINTGRGRNFGWPCYEGGNAGSAQQGSYANNAATSATCAALYAQGLGAVQAPLYAYDHSQGASSIQAGGFYRGTVYPAQYQNALFFADYNADWIRYLTFDINGNATANNFGTDVAPVGGIVQLLIGPDTNLYYVAYNGPSPNTSEVRRIRYTAGGNTPPTANASADPDSGYVPLTVNFSSLGSFDPDAQPLTYSWDFGDGNTGTGPNPSHTYTDFGTFTATLTVTDSMGATGTDTVTIDIGNLQPVANIIAPANGFPYNTGDTINYNGTGTDNEDGNLTGASLQWDVLLHHNQHVHFDAIPGLIGNTGSFVVPDHGDNSWIELCLTVTDSGGLNDQECVNLTPNTVTLTFDTVPTGLILEYDGVDYTTPFNVVANVNSVRDLIAPLTQQGCQFTSWSDGGTASHQITVGASPQTYVATYASCPATLTTTIHDAGHAPITNTSLGMEVHDSALVTGIGSTVPTGNVTFMLFPNLTCAGPGTVAGTVALDGSGLADPSNTATVTNSGLSFRASYSGDANYTPQTGPCETLEVQPAITSADNTTFNVGSAGSFTVTTTGLPTVSTISLSGDPLPSGVTFTDNGDGTATLAGTPDPSTEGTYNLVFTASNGVLPDAVQNFTLTVAEPLPPTISEIDGINTIASTPDNKLTQNEVVKIEVTQFTVKFDRDVLNVGSGDPNYGDSVTNPANYMLVRDNGSGFETVTCEEGIAGDDIGISIDSVTYDNNNGAGPFIATLSVNQGLPLSNGLYRLFVCGTSSITNLFGVPLAGDGSGTIGTDFVRQFIVNIPNRGGAGGGNTGGGNANTITGGLIPVTGFAPDKITSLPEQPSSLAYSDTGGMWLEIPSLSVNIPIVGVKQTRSGWDLTWLGGNAGYLEGSAYPTWEGNTVLTAHVLDNRNAPGPFAYLSELKTHDLIYIHADGWTYVYQVEESAKVSPSAIDAVFKHEKQSWLTLVTCEDYSKQAQKYLARRMVRAALISVIADK